MCDMTTGMFVTGNNVLGPTKDADQDDILPDGRCSFFINDVSTKM